MMSSGSRAWMSTGQQPRQRSPTSVASPGTSNNSSSKNAALGAADGAPSVTPPPPSSSKSNNMKSNAKAKVMANKATRRGDQHSHPDMIVDNRVLDELLLVCSVIGSTTIKTNPTTGATYEQFVPVTDCFNWLQDLQRALRRDHETYRPISLKLGQWKVVSQKLLPLVMSCRYDKAMVLTVCKILVILTKPLSDSAKNAGRMSVDVKSGKVDDSVIREQIILRDNAIEQADLLMEYKHLFVKHPSHHYAFKEKGVAGAKRGEKDTKAADGMGLMSIFSSLLAEPLSKTGSSRTSADHLTIELVLHLIRNLLSISPLNTFGSPEKSQYASQLHRELLIVLQEEMVLDVLVCVGQEVERRENSGYNLLLMEILSCLLRGQDPSDVARCDNELQVSSLSAPITIVDKKKKASSSTTKSYVVRTTVASKANSSGHDSLTARLQSERQKLQLSTSSRHSHFGGTLLISKPGGKQSYVSAIDYLAKKSNVSVSSSTVGVGGGAGGSSTVAAAGQPTRRRNKKAEVFVGSGKSSSLHSGASATLPREVAGPTAKRAKLALNSFCTKFVQDCYGPVMKSLKNEFRRDSNRLEDGDRTMFFRIVWFFHQWWRISKEQKGELTTKDLRSVGATIEGLENAETELVAESSTHNIIFTMDVFMFNLVLNSTDEFFEHKKPAALAQSVSLYTEMIQMLHVMYESKDSTERMMALGLMDRLFYATEPLDRLPRLLSRWSPGMFSREYLCDLVECAHVTWKLLDTNAERCLQTLSPDEPKRPQHAVERMNMTASEFDKNHHFMRKFMSNQIVFMYTQLLSQYDVNASHINRHIVAYFIRLSKFTINDVTAEEADFDDALGKNELATKQSTMEPILYNIGLFTVLDKILNDPIIRDKEDFTALLMFASSFMHRFARAAEVNPMLYVEAMFKHPIPHRFCELTTNMYVNEELRMIAVRDLLLEDQVRYEQQETKEAGEIKDRLDDKTAHAYDEDEDNEFNDDDETDGIFTKKKIRRRMRKSRKSKKVRASATTEEDDDKSDGEEEEEEEFNDDVAGSVTSQNGQGNADEIDGKRDNDGDSTGDTHDRISPVIEETLAIDETVRDTSKLSGMKRIRKSLEHDSEDSEDEDFLGSAGPTKLTKRTIFDDDEDD